MKHICGRRERRNCTIAFEPKSFDAVHAYAKRRQISFNEAARRAINVGLQSLIEAEEVEAAATG